MAGLSVVFKRDRKVLEVFNNLLIKRNIGGASAGGIMPIVFANIVAIFLMRMIAKNMNSD